ncbi:hypothetical protein B0J11DRAFT_539511 [Dendryphion nanum]|uniref:Uncharacterized protein n=1 Tax=Dendryphion nanum TaxID=256645 RepID=A0A9P9IC92_9PLEO|nr:hypothetical protein B0J11DRAFT_539511 [Dendryphion nanum]
MPVPVPSGDKPQSTVESVTADTAHHVQNPSTQSVASQSQQEKTEAEREADRLYEERIEEEYAKREGGA